MNIAVIPARGGSKRIPRKNIKEFCGWPMISYAINAAKESNLFDRIIVSTDDEEISILAKELGAEIPFMRPSHLADDYTETVPVISHAIESCQRLGWNLENVCCIYPCVPFIRAEDLIGAFRQIVDGGALYCFPVAHFPSSVQRSLRRLRDGKMKPLYPEFEKTRTQDLEPAYYDVGQFYWAKADTWLYSAHIHSDGLGYVIPNWRAIDIDSPEDWHRAEILYKALT
jgi:pseudaminic acid cytidylyltransferase